MEDKIINDYKNGMNIYGICSKYHIGKLKVKKILSDNGIPLRKQGAQPLNRQYLVNDFDVEKYPLINGFIYIAKSKDGKYQTKDYMNLGGFLTRYIHNEYGVTIPSLHHRKEYYKMTGNYWWEQWFDIVKEKKQTTKQCPYCGWETIDVDNKSGVFAQHLLQEHNKTIQEYVQEFPDDLTYFKGYKKKIERKELLKNSQNYVLCPLCNEKLKKISWTHLSAKHNISMCEFRNKFPNISLASETTNNKDSYNLRLGNLSTPKKRYISKYEREIKNFLIDKHITVECNRQILIGKEIDLLIPDKKIGIEFNGLFWHREGSGKDKDYHLNKTILCNNKGYGLIHIFEDEYVEHKDIVLSKLSHLLGLDKNLPKIAGRKIVVKEIYSYEAKTFLQKFHIQGWASSTIYLGGFYNGELISVMSFKFGNIKNKNWDLTRFATNNNNIYQGVASKMLKWFIRKYTPEVIVSFADRRWTLDKDNNLYTKLGFKLETINKPDYKYYHPQKHDIKRIHKMTFSKKALIKKYGFPETMTEKEMTKELGYDRIWDCGLFKYVWKNPN